MKTLVVYYSFEGSTKLMAETIASAIGADLMAIKPVNEIKTHGFMKFIWGGRQVMMKESPEILPLDKNPNDYDLIIIGTPVWAWTFTPPVKTFLEQAKITGKKIALFCSFGGDAGKTFINMAAALPGNEIVGELGLKEPVKTDTEENKQKTAEWAKKLVNNG